MKHAAWIILAAIVLTACEKKYCWECEIKDETRMTTATGDSMYFMESDLEPQCDMTVEEIASLQEQKTAETITQDGEFTVRKSVTYRCEKAD